MYIRLIPLLSNDRLDVARAGDVLTLNGTAFDLSALPEGGTLPAAAIDSEWFFGPVSRINGELHLTLRLPHGPNPSRAVAFPAPLTVLEDGPIPLPFDPVPENVEVLSE